MWELIVMTNALFLFVLDELVSLINSHPTDILIVFCNTVRSCDWTTHNLKSHNIDMIKLHGGFSAVVCVCMVVLQGSGCVCTVILRGSGCVCTVVLGFSAMVCVCVHVVLGFLEWCMCVHSCSRILRSGGSVCARLF